MSERLQTRLRVVHETRYKYASRVEFAHHLAYLRPLEAASFQMLDRFGLTITPRPSYLAENRDSYGNARVFFSLYVPHRELIVRAESALTIADRFAGVDLDAGISWEKVRKSLRYEAGEPWLEPTEYVFASPFVLLHAELRDYALGSFTPDRPLRQAALDLMHRIHADFTYESASTDVSTPLLEAFQMRRGVCQDFAHVFISCMRSLGLAAAYVSGYLLTHPPAGRPRLTGADASHAWASVWCPDLSANSGWLDLDPTNDLVPSMGHVVLARGRDYGDVAPLRGVIRGGRDHELSVAVSVEPVGTPEYSQP
jgi:transglutaminase-like putative cysteine protease